MFYDLSVPYDGNLQEIVPMAIKLGYGTVAFSMTSEGKCGQEEANAFKKRREKLKKVQLKPDLDAPLKMSKAGPNFSQLSRLTINLSDKSQLACFNSTNPFLTHYDILAVRPSTEALFHVACEKLEVDIVTVDLGTKLGFPLRTKVINMAIQRGVFFEIAYSGCLKEPGIKRYTIANATELVRVTKGKNIIFTSEALSALDMRGPYDITNLGTLFGLEPGRAKEALTKNPRAAVMHGFTRKAVCSTFVVQDVKELPEGDWKVTHTEQPEKMDVDNPKKRKLSSGRPHVETNKSATATMKRQRTDFDDFELTSSSLSFNTLVKFFKKDPTFSGDQLLALEGEIHRLYGLQVNSITQSLPADLWLQIFSQVRGLTFRHAHEEVPFWIRCRTVSKLWLHTVNKIDFSTFSPIIESFPYNPSRMLEKFKFSSIQLYCHLLPTTLLTNIKSLWIDDTLLAVSHTEYDLGTLTQLTSLRINGPNFSCEALSKLTNLQSLSVTKNLHINLETIGPLTNLQSLDLRAPFSLTSDDTKCLPKLTQVTVNHPQYFRSGRGRCFWDGCVYEGEFLDGQMHGKGSYVYSDHDRYEGDWFQGQQHGRGILSFWNKKKKTFDGSYDGDWTEGLRSGKALRTYRNGETYEGDFIGGHRRGHGVYKFNHGTVFDGEWQGGEMTGIATCVYGNGDSYAGSWKKGRRHGEGVDTFAQKDGTKLAGNWYKGTYITDELPLEATPVWGRLYQANSEEEMSFEEASSEE